MLHRQAEVEQMLSNLLTRQSSILAVSGRQALNLFQFRSLHILVVAKRSRSRCVDPIQLLVGGLLNNYWCIEIILNA